MGNLLEKIHSPDDLKSLTQQQLGELSDEIRAFIIDTVSNNGGHLASNLGVVELTIALARTFDLPEDKIIWDVGHQSYPYKLLTGRYDRFSTIRMESGLSGFPNRQESPYDTLTTGHSSTSISAALGVSEANSLQQKDGYVVAVIGDGALTGGLAYEGLNNAGRLHRNFIVILNDNNMSISKNVGSMARYLTYMRTKPGYIRVKKNLETTLSKIPVVGRWIAKGLKKVKRGIKKLFYSTTLFEDFGFAYYGPFDGHNIKELTDTFESVKLLNKPVLLHVRTYKGKGYRYAELSPTEFHGLSGFDVQTGDTGSSEKSFSDVFGKALCKMAEENPKICAITAAMQDGTGLSGFRNQFRDRFYDVGIAEEHAVTFSGGLSIAGMLPVFAVYSTFLQRAYDELIHDIALQHTKMLLAIDRAGVVGEDGPSHQGIFDAAFLQTIPGMTLYSPSYFDELAVQLRYLAENGAGICAVRYPRGMELYKPDYVKATANPFECYLEKSAKVAIVTYGRIFSFAAKAAEELTAGGTEIKLIKLNRIVPVDAAAVKEAAAADHVFFFEEGVKAGGIGEHFLFLLYGQGFRGAFHLTAIENQFIPHAPMFETLQKLGFTKRQMKDKIEAALQKENE